VGDRLIVDNRLIDCQVDRNRNRECPAIRFPHPAHRSVERLDSVLQMTQIRRRISAGSHNQA
jgi:hypothetical protein